MYPTFLCDQWISLYNVIYHAINFSMRYYQHYTCAILEFFSWKYVTTLLFYYFPIYYVTICASHESFPLKPFCGNHAKSFQLHRNTKSSFFTSKISTLLRYLNCWKEKVYSSALLVTRIIKKLQLICVVYFRIVGFCKHCQQI